MMDETVRLKVVWLVSVKISSATLTLNWIDLPEPESALRRQMLYATELRAHILILKDLPFTRPPIFVSEPLTVPELRNLVSKDVTFQDSSWLEQNATQDDACHGEVDDQTGDVNECGNKRG